MASIKSGVGIDPALGLSREQQRRLVQAAAGLGFDSLWCPAGLTRLSIFQLLRDWFGASAEVRPGGLEVGTSVIPFPGWTPTTLAAESASLNEETSGKFMLGIGLGGYPSAGLRTQLGLPDVPAITLTREFVAALTGLFSGEKVSLAGQAIKLQGVQLSGFTHPRVPVYLAAMGPQILRLSGELADGVTPNWSSPEQLVWMRERAAEGARKAGRAPEHVPFAQYIRVCIDDDETAARRAFTRNMLGYAMARRGQPTTTGYRGHFGRMGFEEVLTRLEAKRDAGTPVDELVDEVPEELVRRVGYFGTAAGAAAEFKRLAQGLDEAMVRLITVRPGDLDACVASIRALQPTLWAG